MSITQQIGFIFKHVREHGEYINRDHPTIGGMWTTDTWMLNTNLPYCITVRLCDEGYTQWILTEKLNVIVTHGREPQWNLGGPKELQELVEYLA